jgi:sugar phosphate isomerase/epimerase
MSQPGILLSGFADEAARHKTLDQQFSVLAALGMRYFSIRFVDAGKGVKNVMALDDDEIEQVRARMADYGISVSSLGSPIGKVKLCDVNDGTTTPYRPFGQYLEEEIPRACELTNRFGAKLIRGFSFYHPQGDDPEDHVAQATDQVGQIADVCQRHGLTYGLEVEANLVGQNGQILARMHREIRSDALVLVFDGGNLVTQGFSADEVFQNYCEMKRGLGWIHVKDFRWPTEAVTPGSGYVDEEALHHFVPVEFGQSGYGRILQDLVEFLPELQQRMSARGVPGVFVDLEPHLKGGGQFGGFSGPDGFGVALRSFCRLCDQAGIGYELRDFDDVCADRGS